MLLDFPHDIQSLILRKLHLNEIGYIRQVLGFRSSFIPLH